MEWPWCTIKQEVQVVSDSRNIQNLPFLNGYFRVYRVFKSAAIYKTKPFSRSPNETLRSTENINTGYRAEIY